MRKILLTVFYPFLMLFSCKEIKNKPANVSTTMNTTSFYDLSMTSIDGSEINFSRYKGKRILIVNTASECGYTPQYKELQKLHEQYGDKLVVLGFPANNFGAQEPGSDKDIAAFCEKNFGVTFQLFKKSDVVGDNKNVVFKWLTDKSQNGWNTDEPQWNFSKYLVNEKGELVKVFSSSVSPLDDQIVSGL
ncbi:MAG: glutathione peroxidase [Bacteroidetes bacterium]|nr:glutathione peroxidase [Bacteroidota bacterium]